MRRNLQTDGETWTRGLLSCSHRGLYTNHPVEFQPLGIPSEEEHARPHASLGKIYILGFEDPPLGSCLYCYRDVWLIGVAPRVGTAGVKGVWLGKCLWTDNVPGLGDDIKSVTCPPSSWRGPAAGLGSHTGSRRAAAGPVAEPLCPPPLPARGSHPISKGPGLAAPFEDKRNVEQSRKSGTRF